MAGEVRDGGDGEIRDLHEVEREVSAFFVEGDRVRSMAWAARAMVRQFAVDRARHDHEDLLYEALGQTLDGRRSWKKEVDLERHLRLVMRSIASSWRRTVARTDAAGAREVRSSELWSPDEKVDPKDLPGSLQGALASPLPDAEAALVAQEQLEGVLRRFADDEPARLVILGLAEGLDGGEIQRRLEITARQLKTTKERIRRKARRTEAGDVE